MTKDELLRLTNEVLQDALEEDQYVLELILTGLKKSKIMKRARI
jgi:hypothetical protein